MNSDKAGGVLEACLERVALHFGMIDVGKLGSINQDRTYGSGASRRPTS